MVHWLGTLPHCFVAWDGHDGRVPTMDFNDDYEIGFNFLGSKRIPAEQLGDGRRWINWHPAPLPEYGGRNVAYHAIMEGAKEFGATIHYMTAEMDAGDIIECHRFPIHAYSTAGSIMELAKQHCVSLFQKWVPELLKGPVPARKQVPNYYKKQPINDFLWVSDEQKRVIRALTYHPQHHARIDIGGRTYRITPEE
jgi:methionyl-tRNA formyltransferase